MSLRGPLLDLDDRSGAATGAQPARSVQWAALARVRRGAVAADAQRAAPREAVYQQTQRWVKAGVFEAIVHDRRVLLRLAEGRKAQPAAAIFDSRTPPSTPESGARAG
jgi:hypothetical protein